MNKIKQPEGCIGISEKSVFAGKSLLSRYRAPLKWVCLASVVLQVLFLNLIYSRSFRKNATRRAVGDTHAKVFSLKKYEPSHSFLSGPHVFPRCLSPLGENNCIQLKFNVFYGPILKHEREMWSSAFRLG